MLYPARAEGLVNMIGLDCVFQKSIDLTKENDYALKCSRIRQYPSQTLTDADYADDTALLANTQTQSEYQLHGLEQAAGSIGLHRNANKTEYMCFSQEWDLPILNSCPLT